jgi:hypothetical protein
MKKTQQTIRLHRHTISNLTQQHTRGGISGGICENPTEVDPNHTRRMNLSCGYTMVYNCTVSVLADCLTVGSGCYATGNCPI